MLHKKLKQRCVDLRRSYASPLATERKLKYTRNDIKLARKNQEMKENAAVVEIEKEIGINQNENISE